MEKGKKENGSRKKRPKLKIKKWRMI